MRSLAAVREPTTTSFSVYERESFVYAETELLSRTVSLAAESERAIKESGREKLLQGAGLWCYSAKCF